MAESAPARSLTAGPTIPFRTFLTVNPYPYCPACGEALSPDAWSVRYSVAVCWRCKNHRLQSCHLSALCLRQPEMRDHVCMRNGIAFYCPAYREFTMQPAITALEKLCDGRPLFEPPGDSTDIAVTLEKVAFTEEERASIKAAADRLPTRSRNSEVAGRG